MTATASHPSAVVTARKPLGKHLATIMTTTDHKLIGKLYLGTSFAWFLIGGAMAWAFFKAKGMEIGMSYCPEGSPEAAEKVLSEMGDHPDKLVLPVDVHMKNEQGDHASRPAPIRAQISLIHAACLPLRRSRCSVAADRENLPCRTGRRRPAKADGRQVRPSDPCPPRTGGAVVRDTPLGMPELRPCCPCRPC